MRWFCFLLASGLALANHAEICGVITDASGAVVPRAAVALVSQDTGVRRNTVSTGEGFYAIASIKPGTYKLSVRKDGFKTAMRLNLRLGVAEKARLDFRLEVGDAAQQVVVVEGRPESAGATADDGSVGRRVPRKFIERLPVNGRGLLTLLEVSPGVLITPVTGGQEFGQFVVNGQRPNTNDFSVDGVSASFGLITSHDAVPAVVGLVPPLTAIGSMHSIASLPAVEEFRVVSSTYTAEHGRGAGGHLVISTKSGTNELHGELFHYLRNEKLDANNWFNNASGAPRSPFRWNNFGASAGGPLAKDRTFFFGAYEGFRLAEPGTIVMPVPSLELRASAPQAARVFYDAFPLPTGPNTGDRAEFRAGESPLRSMDSASARLDHSFRPGISSFVRFHRAPSKSEGIGGWPALLARSSYSPLAVTVGNGMAIGPGAFYEARLNHSRMRYHFAPSGPMYGTAAPDITRLAPAITPLDRSAVNVTINDGYFSIVTQPNSDFRQAQWNTIHTLAISRGKHQVKTGVDYRWVRLDPGYPQFQMNIYYTDAAAFARGDIFNLFVTRNTPARITWRRASGFIQDSWAATGALTVTYGLRWEWTPAPSLAGQVRPVTLSGTGNPSTMRLADAGEPLWRTRRDNFAPRVGVAWRAAPAWVVRGGLGLHYDVYASTSLGTALSLPPFKVSRSYFNVSRADASKLALPEAVLPAPPYDKISAFAQGFRVPTVAQWNTSLEYGFRARSSVSLGWVGAAGRELIRREYYYRPNPLFNAVDLTGNEAFSDYHALQVNLRSRPLARLDVMAAYNWSHSIDNASLDSEQMLPSSRQLDKGNSRFDIRHSFTAAFSWEAAFLKGWAIDGIFRARTGFPIDLRASWSTWLGENVVVRPDLVAGRSIWLEDAAAAGGRRLNAAAFADPAAGRQGTLARNAIAGFPLAQFDAALHRTFRLRKRAGLEVRAEAFNLLNQPNFDYFGLPFTSQVGFPTFGRSMITADQSLSRGSPENGLISLLQIGGPRSVQLSLRIRF